jgi:hypothetical protein
MRVGQIAAMMQTKFGSHLQHLEDKIDDENISLLSIEMAQIRG